MKKGSLRALWLSAAVCSATLAFSPAFAQNYITLAEGGGVTGNTTVFRISDSGIVVKGTGNVEPEFSELAHLRKGKTRKYFRKTRALMKAQTFNHPGNMYTAITLAEGGKEAKLAWGDAAHATPVEAEVLYRKIQHSLNRLTFRKDLRK